MPEWPNVRLRRTEKISHNWFVSWLWGNQTCWCSQEGVACQNWKNANSLAETKHYEWLQSLNRRHIRYFRLVFPHSSKCCKLVSILKFCIFLYNQAQPPPNVPKNRVWMILQDFEWFAKGFDKKYDCYTLTGLQSAYRANRLHICKLIFYFMFSHNLELNVTFVYKYFSQLQTGLILKRSAGKKLSETGWYKVHSHNFFKQKF